MFILNGRVLSVIVWFLKVYEDAVKESGGSVDDVGNHDRGELVEIVLGQEIQLFFCC